MLRLREWVEDDLTLNSAKEMALATATSEGKPSNRFVLLKFVDETGLVFFTNYVSRKARELEQNPNAAAVMFWPQLRRQVRVEGTVGRISALASDTYFTSRDRGSQISAWAPAQSTVIKDRRELEDLWAKREHEFANMPIPRPAFWGGYRLTPSLIEFWEGQENRLHDRARYTRTDDKWLRERLAP